MSRKSKSRSKGGTVVHLRRRRRIDRRVAATIVFVIAGTAVWAVASMRIQEVRVAGTTTLSPDVVITAAALQGNERILFTRLGPVARRVESLPAIRRARVERSLPSEIVIHVVERTPLMRFDAHPEISVDRDGRMFPTPKDANLPVLAGWAGRVTPGGSTDPRTRSILTAFEKFPEKLRAGSKRMILGASLVLQLHEGTEVRFGDALRLPAKGAAAWAVLFSAHRRGEKLAYIDVRAPTAPVAREVATPAPSPAPSPGRAGAAPTPAA